jgi:hypothetical protein
MNGPEDLSGAGSETLVHQIMADAVIERKKIKKLAAAKRQAAARNQINPTPPPRL